MNDFQPVHKRAGHSWELRAKYTLNVIDPRPSIWLMRYTFKVKLKQPSFSSDWLGQEKFPSFNLISQILSDLVANTQYATEKTKIQGCGYWAEGGLKFQHRSQTFLTLLLHLSKVMQVSRRIWSAEIAFKCSETSCYFPLLWGNWLVASFE